MKTHDLHGDQHMKRSRLYTVAVLAAGAALGWAAASSRLAFAPMVRAANDSVATTPGAAPSEKKPCCDGASAATLLVAHNNNVAARAEQSGKKPNICII